MLSLCCVNVSGLSNPEEFSFTSDEETQEQTMRRQGHHARDQKRLDTLKKKLHTDDECKHCYLPSRVHMGYIPTQAIEIGEGGGGGGVIELLMIIAPPVAPVGIYLTTCLVKVYHNLVCLDLSCRSLAPKP